MSDKHAAADRVAVADVSAFAWSWCRRRRLPRELSEDLVQEAHLAALSEGPRRRSIVRAMDRYRKRESRRAPCLSAVGTSAGRFADRGDRE